MLLLLPRNLAGISPPLTNAATRIPGCTPVKRERQTETERDRERERDRETARQRDRETERQRGIH